MNNLETFLFSLINMNLSPMAMGSLVLVGVVVLMSVVTFMVQVKISSNRSWYTQRCKVLSKRHRLNTGESKFLKGIRKPNVSAFKLLPVQK